VTGDEVRRVLRDLSTVDLPDDELDKLAAKWTAKWTAAEERIGVVHRDGLPWNEAPLPRRWHRCAPWTTLNGYWRCACGGWTHSRPGRVVWVDRNWRRHMR
jgi:hypothetical protein